MPRCKLVGTKICSACEQEQPLTEFYTRRGKQSLSSKCATCLCEYGKKWYRANPKKVKAWRERYKTRRTEWFRNNWLERAYGITAYEYDKLFDKQKGRCAICNKPEVDKHNSGKIKKLSVDHCHANGKIRALLCAKCNRGLGMFLHDSRLLKRAILYLEKYAD